MNPLDVPLVEISPEQVATCLQQPNDVRCRAFLSSLEKAVKNALQGPIPRSSAEWLKQISSILISSQESCAQDLRAEILLSIVQWHYAQGRSQEGIPLAERALELATAAKARSLQRRVLNNLGALHIDCRNLSAATICLAEGVQIAEELGDRIGKCATLANLATARFEAGLVDEALKLYRYVIELTENNVILQQLAVEAHHNISLASLVLDDLGGAKSHMDAAISRLVPPTTPFSIDQRVVMELTFTKVFVRLGDVAGAQDRANLARRFAEESGSPRAKIQSQLAAVLCEAASGQIDIALENLKGVERCITPTEPAYRDLLEIELLCNKIARRQQYERYYSKRYLSNLAAWQRSSAIAQIAALKRTSLQASVSLHSASTDCDGSTRLLESRDRATSVLQCQLENLAALSETREERSGEHCYRVARLARMLALAAGLPPELAQTIEFACRLHDIGKLAVPDAVLLKRSKLTASEEQIIRKHTTEGCQMLWDILSCIDHNQRPKPEIAVREYLRHAAEIALHHHEWWNGQGYPRKISQDRIPEAARIVAICDAFDEMTHDRPYRTAVSTETALSRIAQAAGIQFDPRLSDLFLNMAQQLSKEPISDWSPPESSPTFVDANRVIRRILHDPSIESALR